MNETEYEKLVKRLERASKRVADYHRNALHDPKAAQYQRELREAVEAMHAYYNRPPGAVFTVVRPFELN